MACSQEATAKCVYFNLFCDGSKALDNPIHGGISVTYQPLGRRHPRDVVGLAWPVNPIYHPRLGGLLALSECLVVAIHHIAEVMRKWPEVAGKTIVVRIFNDNMFNLEHFAGVRALDDGFLMLAKPVLDMISMQSWAIRHMRPGVELELHWIPGHYHSVGPHQWADDLAREARLRRQTFSSTSRDMWGREEEPCVVWRLKRELAESAAKAAARYMPELRGEFFLFSHFRFSLSFLLSCVLSPCFCTWTNWVCSLLTLVLSSRSHPSPAPSRSTTAGPEAGHA
jgi:hypothetical protein